MKPLAERKEMISKGHPTLSVVQQCVLLTVCRSGFYYCPKGESALNLELMRLMDEHYLYHPEKGAERMYDWLSLDLGYAVNKKRIERLYYRVMGLRAILPGKHTSRRHKDHMIYPYLLRDLVVTRPNQVWAIDITYIPMKKGYLYLVAIIDLYSRYVVGWSLSNSMDAQWCRDCLQEAIRVHGRPGIVNTDQGSQFTSEVFSGFVLKNEIRLSMDGKGRATDNAFIERLWRSVKYEKLYPNPTSDGMEVYDQLEEYFDYYNHERRHDGIDKARPVDLYHDQAIQQAA